MSVAKKSIRVYLDSSKCHVASKKGAVYIQLI